MLSRRGYLANIMGMTITLVVITTFYISLFGTNLPPFSEEEKREGEMYDLIQEAINNSGDENAKQATVALFNILPLCMILLGLFFFVYPIYHMFTGEGVFPNLILDDDDEEDDEDDKYRLSYDDDDDEDDTSSKNGTSYLYQRDKERLDKEDLEKKNKKNKFKELIDSMKEGLGGNENG